LLRPRDGPVRLGVSSLFRVPAESELLQNILDPANKFASLLDQGVRAPAYLSVNLSGHDEYIPSLLQGEIGRDQRAAVPGGFSHQYPQGQSADHPVPAGKILL